MYLNPYFAQQMSAARTREAVEAADNARLAAQAGLPQTHRASARWTVRRTRPRPRTVWTAHHLHPRR
jgi:hypothetical protein